MDDRPRLDPTYSRNEVAEALGISLGTLEAMHARNEAPPRHKISPRRWGYPKSLYDAWQRDRLKKAAHQPR